MLPARWNVTEEVYNFLTDPRAVGAKVLLSVDETTIVDGYVSPQNDGTPHPIGKLLVSFSTPLSTAPLFHCSKLNISFVPQPGTKTDAPAPLSQTDLWAGVGIPASDMPT